MTSYNLDWFHYFLLIMLGCTLIIIVFMGFTMPNCDSCNMRFNQTDMQGVEGLYSHHEYMCIWTEGRSLEEIMSTFHHELIHAMTVEEREHFKIIEDKE